MRLILQRSARQIATACFGLIVLGWFSACNNDESAVYGAVIGFADVPIGDECAYGGVAAQAGEDNNHNKVLDENEVQTSQILCNGFYNNTTSGQGLLMSSTTLYVGDAHCPNGGTMIQVGLDSGEMNGELEEAEVGTTEYACNGNGTFTTPSIMPPSGPAGSYSIDFHGGSGSTDTGGSGGNFSAVFSEGSLGGHIKFFKTGTVDTSFDLPENISSSLGETPFEFTADTTVPALADGSTLSDGQIHIRNSQSALYLRQNSTDVRITGIRIASGVTVTFEPNYGGNSIDFSLENDVINEGHIIAGLIGATRNRSELHVSCNLYRGLAGSSVSTRGEDGGTGEDGGEGNDAEINTARLLVNEGSFDSSGGDGDAGGNSGFTYLHSYGNVYNSGAISTQGGNGSVSTGGNGSYSGLGSDQGSVFNSATLSAIGGTGMTVGGSAGYGYIFAYRGTIVNSGDFMLQGGNVNPSCTTTCSGGSGGVVYLYAAGAQLKTSGNFIAHGGTGTTGNGGNGGYAQVYTGTASGSNGTLPAGSIHVTGDWQFFAGNGASGGPGGLAQVVVAPNNYARQQEIIFYGYASLSVNAGSGGTNGGSAGSLALYQSSTQLSGWPAYGGPSGGVINYLDINCFGGNGADGAGGNGGDVNMETEYQYGFDADSEIVMNYGDINCAGGNGTTMGGYGGDLYFWGYNHAENQGNVDTRGGNASASSGTGRNGGDFGLFSDLGPAINSGTVNNCGGSATADGGNGGSASDIEIVGYSVQNSGDLLACGGDGNTTNGTGGDGGYIFVRGLYEAANNTADSIDVSGGSASTAGETGVVYIDDLNVTDSL
ncbi:MAG: hypothetical protein IPJ88_17695 [Myxococcales bacterium]|nr:MAG: hypothetical protein IPJ88_17695 [Myxococcales bacterium]